MSRIKDRSNIPAGGYSISFDGTRSFVDAGPGAVADPAVAMRESWPPPDAVPLVSFVVLGVAKGAGSKDAIPLGRWVREKGRKPRFVPITRDSGVPIVNVVDSSGEAGENWRADIRQAAADALDMAQQLEDGPVAVRVTFYGKSPAKRFGTGRNAGVLKATADRFPHASELPDGTKLARALEDALNTLVWADDRRVCDMWWSRRFAEEWEHGRPGARVDIFTLPVALGRSVVTEQALTLLGPDGAIESDQSVIMGDDDIDTRTEALAS